MLPPPTPLPPQPVPCPSSAPVALDVITLPPPHFLQPCGLCMGGSLCCQFLALPHPHPPLRTFRGCSFQKNYLKRTFAASKSAFSIMSYESITAGCLFAGRACSTHPPSSPVPPRLRPCTLLTLPPPHFLQPCGLCMGGSLCCQFLALPHPHPPLRSFGGCSFQKKLSKTHFYSLEKCIFDDVLEKYCCWLTVLPVVLPPPTPPSPQPVPCPSSAPVALDVNPPPTALPPALWAVHGWKPLLPVLSPPPPPPAFTHL